MMITVTSSKCCYAYLAMCWMENKTTRYLYEAQQNTYNFIDKHLKLRKASYWENFFDSYEESCIIEFEPQVHVIVLVK